VTHLTEEDQILVYYNEPGTNHAKKHLAECAECQAAADSLARALSVCNEWTAPERPPDFGHDVWIRLAPQLDVPARKAPGWHGFRIWAAAAGFAVLLLAVFLAGRYSRPASVVNAPVMAALSDQARERILAIAVADHLDRVQILLTEISDTSDTNSEILAADRDRAEDLVQEGRLMRQSLAAQGESATTNFMDEVERFLIEAAHTPDSAPTQAVAELRDRIESGSLLFKVRIVESNLRSNLSKRGT
jgi:hypothetical protein